MRNVLGIAAFSVAVLAAAVDAAVYTEPPVTPDRSKTHLIYLHGGILTGTKGDAVSEYWGRYEYGAIVQRFANEGFEVISEVRSHDDVDAMADRLEGWIRQLQRSGVPSSRIAVVGASMGGIIAGRVSHRLRDKGISYVLVASLYDMASLPPLPLSGRVLAIRDSADDRKWVERRYLVESDVLAESQVVITQTGRGHGLLVTADDAWVLPALEWIRR